MSVLSPTARELYGSLWTFISPRLAADQSVADLNLSSILSGVTGSNLSSQIPAIARKVKSAARRRLALDADLDDLPDMLGSFEDERGEGGQEPGERLDAAQAFQAFKNLLMRLDPAEHERFMHLCSEYGYATAEAEDEPAPFATGGRPRPGGEMDPIRRAEDRRARYALDSAATSGFHQKFPNAGKLLIT